MNCDYIRRVYGVPAEIGRRVEVDGRPGIIAEDMGAYVGILFDDQKPNVILPHHPTSHIEYLDMGTVRKMTRSQKRYHDYLKVSDCFSDFGQYLAYLSESKRSD